MSRVRTALGLMSGTSMDGVDVAVLASDGRRVLRRGPGFTRPYVPEERALITRALHEARGLGDRAARPGAMAEAECRITHAHAEAVRAFLQAVQLDPATVDVVGFHGQTVLHRPQAGLTVQLGDGQSLARLLGLDVVYDFRAADMAAGGQGAPLAPAYHRALVDAEGLDRPVAVINIGGVANITWVGADDTLVAFDTGPGNALLDDWCLRHTGEAVDRDGALARAGRVDRSVLARLLAHPFFEQTPPKSLDRGDFTLEALPAMAPADGAATLAAFTAEAVAAALRHLPASPSAWIVCGGGARNPALMAVLAERVPQPVWPAAALGWSADHMEAEAFAYLAVRSLEGLPLSWPGTTGVARPQTGGVVARACGRSAA